MTADHGADQGGPGFDAVLRSYRLRAKLTQDELAARAGVGVRTVRDLERGRASRPQRTTVELLAAALGLAGADRRAFLAAARGQARPSAAAADRATCGLPPAGDLIGRDGDVAELVARLSPARADGPRGVTLVGLAGVGKTSLALAVAHRVADGLPGRRRRHRGHRRLHRRRGARRRRGRLRGGPARRSGRPVRRPPALLLVDAVERAPEAVAEALSRLLAPAPDPAVPGHRPAPGRPARRTGLAGRAAGRAAGRGRHRRSPTWSAYPAVALFLDRLRPGAPRAARARRGARRWSALVRRLGGLPLAIELAAARGRVLTVAEILDRYGDRVLDLSGRPPAPGRGRLRCATRSPPATGCSTPDEQRALRRLAMFRNRWSLELAEADDRRHRTDGRRRGAPARPAAGAGPAQRARRPGRSGSACSTWSRDFAAERAAAEGEPAARRRRHAEVLAGLAQEIAPDLVGAQPDRGRRPARRRRRRPGRRAGLRGPRRPAHRAAPRRRAAALVAVPGPGRHRPAVAAPAARTTRAPPTPIRSSGPGPRSGLAQLALEHGAGREEIDSAEAALADFAAPRRRAGAAHRAHPAGRAVDDDRRLRARPAGTARRRSTLARRSGRIRDMAVAENNLTWHEIREGDLAAARRPAGGGGPAGRPVRRGPAAGGGGGQPGRGGPARRPLRRGRAAGPGRDRRAGGRRRSGPPAPGARHGGPGAGRQPAGSRRRWRCWPSCACRTHTLPPDGPAAIVEAAIALPAGRGEAGGGVLRGRRGRRTTGGHDPRDMVEAWSAWCGARRMRNAGRRRWPGSPSSAVRVGSRCCPGSASCSARKSSRRM